MFGVNTCDVDTIAVINDTINRLGLEGCYVDAPYYYDVTVGSLLEFCREIFVILEPSESLKFTAIGDLYEHKHKCNH